MPREGKNPKELRTVFRWGLLISEAHPGFMYERARAQRMPWSLLADFAGREPAEPWKNEPEQLVLCRLTAVGCLPQQLCHLAGW